MLPPLAVEKFFTVFGCVAIVTHLVGEVLDMAGVATVTSITLGFTAGLAGVAVFRWWVMKDWSDYR